MIDLPQKIVCVGLNYRDHAEEQGVGAARAAAALRQVAEHADRQRASRSASPRSRKQVDYEAELGVVIGRRASGVSVDDALDFVEGYVVANDVSGSRPPVLRRPVGARQVARHVPAGRRPRAGERRARSAGAADPRDPERRGDAGLEHVEHDLRRRRGRSSFVSQAITLEPGDLIITGTPAGVGAFRDPPVWLQPGDEITIEIDGVGSITNPVVAG